MEPSTSFAEIEAVVGITFKDPEILKEALTHRSYLNETAHGQAKHNERLEFLGDAVLELVVTHYLYTTYRDRAEGDLTSFRAAVVRTESLAESAGLIKLGEHLLMSRGEARSGGRTRPYILANAFEALIGAVYLDAGYDIAAQFIGKYIISKLDRVVSERSDIDPKSRLQELAQETIKITPIYTLIAETGPDHDKTFEMSVILGNHHVASGTGHSKQEAEQKAAAVALENWDQVYKKHLESGRIQSS